jgi:hypothetical protein
MKVCYLQDQILLHEHIWTSHKTLKSSYTSSKGQLPRFHTPRFVQGLDSKLDDHRRTTNMFRHALGYNT